MARAFGQHMPIRLQMEEYCVGQLSKPHITANGVEASRSSLSLDVLQTFDDDFEFDDYLHQSKYSCEQPPLQFYEILEQKHVPQEKVVSSPN
eukprot:CAMPEP_0201552524 /NCGR_PEP_ID=MMETSP0173_2-20130828/16769_1 /ASSEMBLY_ACC=CAM_ASM_000268 /TAXON_ID=218659 /ORGANISM="Vexillifera sp., Strain DIVA3 564/2" /LENGTH=91 /DNA_ID=CAMNT_0047963025 /DNA_START=210 /DNA_END=485 /DNA_ORIENTATION=+